MLKNKLTKIDLIKILSNQKGFSKNLSKKLIKDLIDIMSQNIKEGNLNLKNFGSFILIHKNERLGRNPKTREKFIISSRNVVKFTPSVKIIKYLNS